MSATVNIVDLLLRSVQVRDETVTNANTAVRVGTLLKLIVEALDALKQYDDLVIDMIPTINANEGDIITWVGGVLQGQTFNSFLNGTLSELVVTNPIGTIESGEVIPEGTPFDTLFRRMLAINAFPTGDLYLRGQVYNLDIEIGDLINDTELFTMPYDKGLAGNVIGSSVIRRVVGENDVALDSTFDLLQLTATEQADGYQVVKNIQYLAYLDFDVSSSYLSGFELSRRLNVKVGRSALFIAKELITEFIDITPAFIRTLENILNPVAGEQFDKVVPAGTKQVIFAYPNILGNISSIESVGLVIEPSSWTMINLMVEGALGYAAVQYNIYYWDIPDGVDSDLTLEFII